MWNTVTHETKNYKFISIPTSLILTFLDNKRQFAATNKKRGNVRGQSIKKQNFFFNLFYLQLNQTRHLQRTPLHSRYAAPKVFYISGACPVTCFEGRRESPVSNFLLSPIPSQIGDLLVMISNLGTRKFPQGSNVDSRAAGGSSRLMLRRKFMDKD